MTFRAISLTVNHTLSGQDFGWDYDNLPAMIQIPHFTLAVNAYCRHGPGENFDISTYGMTGQSYAIEGLSEDGNWFYVRFNDSLQCWMASSRGTSWGELGSLPVVPAPAPPLVNCSQYTVPATCAAQSACSWKFSAAGPGFCTNK
jgi:hypothetical protein